MGKRTSPRTDGERLFELYLKEHGIEFDYQPNLGIRKRPDYVIRADDVTVLCEVAGFYSGEIDKPVAAQMEANRVELPGGFTGAHATGSLSLDAIDQRVRAKIDTEMEQLREFRGRYPLVVVLHNAGTVMPIDDLTVLRAASGFLTPEHHTDVSAIIVVKRGRLADRVYGQVLRGRRKDREGRRRHEAGRATWPSTEEIVEELAALEGEDRHWRGALSEEHGAVRVYHNSHAQVPLPAKVFPPPLAAHALLAPDRRRPRADAMRLQEIRLSCSDRIRDSR